MDNKKVYDLNENYAEHFEFKANDHLYKFRYPTAEEQNSFPELKKLEEGETRGRDESNQYVELMIGFISKVDESAPDFKDVYQKLNILQQKNFYKMITAEIGIEDDE